MMKHTISWSQMQTFLKCHRAHVLKYGASLVPIEPDSTVSTLTGTAFHAGMAAFLGGSSAIDAARQALNKEYDPNCVRWDGISWVKDERYEESFQEAEENAVLMLSYHLPRLGIGKKWRPATEHEVLGNNSSKLFVEYEFNEYDQEADCYFNGFIDAVLVDLDTDELVLVDWKTRGNFPAIDVAIVDGQLAMYEHVLSLMGVNIQRAIMWQLRSKTPSPASISKKSFLPNTGAAGYDTTWEYWVATLPAGIDPKKYEETMRPKMKDDRFYSMPLELFISEETRDYTKRMLYAIVEDIKAQVTKNVVDVPAAMSSYLCAGCGYVRFCANVLRLGGEANEVIAMYYKKKKDRNNAPIQE